MRPKGSGGDEYALPLWLSLADGDVSDDVCHHRGDLHGLHEYVLAGAIVLAVGYLAPGARRRVEGGPDGPARSGLGLILKVVRDWLPAILGLAITTGIAPLLFLQVLYKRHFYTANLLLFNHEKAWLDHYVPNRLIYRNAEIWPRLGYWITV